MEVGKQYILSYCSVSSSSLSGEIWDLAGISVCSARSKPQHSVQEGRRGAEDSGCSDLYPYSYWHASLDKLPDLHL